MANPMPARTAPTPDNSPFRQSTGLYHSKLAAKDSWLLHNISLYRLLGLTPLVAVSETLITAMALGVLTLTVCISSSLAAHPIERFLTKKSREKRNAQGVEAEKTAYQAAEKVETLSLMRIVLFLSLTGFFTIMLDLILQSQLYGLHREIGIYLPLIACNSALLLKLEVLHCSDAGVYTRLQASLTTGLGFFVALILVALCREFLSHGTLLTDFHLLTQETGGITPVMADIVESKYSSEYHFPFISTAAGGLLCLGFILAAFRAVTNKLSNSENEQHSPITPVERVRVTSRSQ